MSEIIKTENLQYAYPTEDGQLSFQKYFKGRKSFHPARRVRRGARSERSAVSSACRLLQRDPSADRRRMLR